MAKTVGDVRLSERVPKTAAESANSSQRRRQEHAEWDGESESDECSEEGWGGQSLTAPLISLVPGTRPPVMQRSIPGRAYRVLDDRVIDGQRRIIS